MSDVGLSYLYPGSSNKDLDLKQVKVPPWVQKEIDQEKKECSVDLSTWFREKASGYQKRKLFLDVLQTLGGRAPEACDWLDWSYPAYKQNRHRWPAFKGYCDAIIASLSGVADPPSSVEGWRGRFVDFRKQFFGFDSPHFHAETAAIVDSGAIKGGDILLCLYPPEHGKTSLAEDYCSYRLAIDPDFTITVASERQDMSKKILGRVQKRMEVLGSAPDFVRMFGPFEPQKAQGARRQPWGADSFDIFKKNAFDDREHSMQALGIGSGVAGTRTQMLLVDDMMSLRNYNHTAKVLETFRQDWLSRPGTKGFTWINGTRVGENDIYERLLEEGLIDHLIIYPAVNDKGEWLWPERYTPEEYARMRRNAGEEAWWRNYMQKPRSAGANTFNEESINGALRPTLSVSSPKRPNSPVYIGIDPAIGGITSMTVVQHTESPVRSLRMLDSRGEAGFVRFEQTYALLEALIQQHSDPGMGSPVTDVVIEQNFLQKGMINDDRLKELRDKYNFRVRGHTTGMNKYDENIGVPQIPLSFSKGEVEIPWAEDEQTRARVEAFLQECRMWRPKRPGSKLRQDRLMSFWFVWILFKERTGHTVPQASKTSWEYGSVHDYSSIGSQYLAGRR